MFGSKDFGVAEPFVVACSTSDEVAEGGTEELLASQVGSKVESSTIAYMHRLLECTKSMQRRAWKRANTEDRGL